MICDVFKPEFLPQILGFKFQYYQGTGELTPSSLYNLTAKLIHRKKLSFDDVLVHLTPDGEEVAEHFKKKWDARMAAAHKAGRLSLTGDDDEKEEGEESEKKAEEGEDENQKFGLVEGLVQIGAMDQAEELLDILEPLHPLHNPRIIDALCRIVAEMIEPLYRASPAGKLALRLPEQEPAAAKGALTSSSEFPAKLFPLLKMLSHYLHHDVKVFCKVARLVKDYCKEVKGDTEKEEEVLSIISLSLLPSVCCIDANPAAVQEVWDILKTLPYQSRFRAYGNFREAAFVDNPDLLTKKGGVVIAAKKCIKRLTKENSKQKGKELAKFAHSNPMEVVSIMLLQAKSYTNMIGPVVEACKYFTSMAFDILSYTLMQHLVGSFNSSKLKEDGQNVAGWLMNLASLTGSLFQKYTTNIELPALLLYVASQLKAAEVLDMFVLRNLLQKAGVESMEDGSDEQLSALGGGPILRVETTFAEQAKLTKKTATRMRDSLLREGNLAVPLYILLCQAREHAIFNSDFGSLKLLSELADKCGDTLIQYTEFMHRHCSADEGFRKSIPSVRDLLVEYNLSAEAAFFLTRPYAFPTGYYSMEALETPSGPLGAALIAATPGLKDGSSKVLGEKLWSVMDESLYTTFWSLSSYDIYVPTEAYDSEIKRQKKEVKRIEKEISESRSMSSSETKKKEKEKKAFAETAQKLSDELKKHKAHYSDVKKRLVSDCKNWIPEHSDNFAYQFLQHCVYPRSVFTAPDAAYCIKFIELLHNNATPNFSTLHFLSTVFDSIHGVLFKCTEAEATRFGRFLLELFSLLESWRIDGNVYKEKVASKPGFCTKFDDPTSKKATFKEYLSVLFKWHQKLARAVVASLDSKEYLEKRNALLVLTKVVTVFPRIKAVFQVVEKKVIVIKDTEERDDLKLLGRRYATMLEVEKKNQVSNEEFKGEPVKAKPAAPVKEEKKRESKRERDMDVDDPPLSSIKRDKEAEDKERALREGALKSSRKDVKEERTKHDREGSEGKHEGKRNREEDDREGKRNKEDKKKDKKKDKEDRREKKEDKAAKDEERPSKRSRRENDDAEKGRGKEDVSTSRGGRDDGGYKSTKFSKAPNDESHNDRGGEDNRGRRDKRNKY